jgi:hypothetical protein
VIAEKPILETIEWLQGGEPWIRYRSRLDLMYLDPDDPLVQHDYNALISDPKIENIIKELYTWPGESIKRHNDANLLIHKLSFLADIGLTIDHPPIHDVVNKIIEFQSKEGPFEVILNIPTHLGGSGKDERSWILCDAPNVLYSLVKFGMEKDKRVQKALKYLIMRSRENGWGCTASSSLGTQFHGPGKKEDPCPYAILLMLKALSQTDTWKYSSACHNGTEALLDLWENSYNKHPFQFKMGTDFRKLKAPLIWFDLLHVVEVLSNFDWVLNDHRFLDMVNVITAKANHKMQFMADSVWMTWEDWDFGQKREPSRWLTFLVLRILKRVERGAGF